MIIAILLTVLVWLGYYAIFPPPKPENVEKNAQKQEQIAKTDPLAEKAASKQEDRNKRKENKTQDITAKKNQKLVKKLFGDKNNAALNADGFQLSRRWLKEYNIEADKEITIDTDLYSVRVKSAGAQITSFRYKNYKEKNGNPVELVLKNEKYLAPKSWPFALDFEISEEKFLSSKKFLDQVPFLLKTETTETGVDITAEVYGSYKGVPIRIQKTYSFENKNNFFVLSYKIDNLSKNEVFGPLQDVILQVGHLVGPDLDLNDPYSPMKFGYFAGEDYHSLGKEGGIFTDTPPSLTKSKEHNIRWIGINSRYFLLGVIPEQPFQNVWADTRPSSSFQMGGFLPRASVAPGESYRHKFFVYVGEKEKDIFATFAENIAKKGYKWPELADSLKNTIDVHWTIEIVRDLLVKFLVLLNKVFGNYGWAIVVFGILTKIVFWPLNQKSADSMKKMSELGPQLKELKERYKDNPQEMNKRTMEIYKKHGVNPASGCLPILIQLPFFFALYSALSSSAVLWNAPFIFWMQDLSSPDTIGHLPEYLGGFSINILPLIMVVSQFFQQKLTTSTVDPNQRRMMYFLPLVFIFIFWHMPSGLVLYWTIQNILAIGQQIYTNHKGKKLSKK